MLTEINSFSWDPASGSSIIMALVSLLDSFVQFTKHEPPVLQQTFLLKPQSRCVIPNRNMQNHAQPRLFLLLENKTQ